MLLSRKSNKEELDKESKKEHIDDEASEKIPGGSLIFERQLEQDKDQRRISEFINGVKVEQNKKTQKVQKMTGLESLNMKKM